MLLLSGCSSSSYWTWQHPDKLGELPLLRDQKICRDLAQREVANINYYDGYYRSFDFPFYRPYYRDRYSRYYFRSYNNFFYNYSYYRFLQQQNDRERFYRICMKSKGWHRVKVVPEANQPVQ
ncbi:MAG: hypothetical protein V2I50_03980 [Desulfuromusa sp.]|jgi:hypothetical protein|nr:hypothetical protein [Desulfuromusa sp.]